MNITFKKVIFFTLIFFLSYSVFLKSKVYAKNFQDNFDSDTLGNWSVTRNPCFNSNWKIVEGKLGIKIIGGSCVTEVIPNDLTWGNLGNDYSVEFDMVLVSGTDHNFAFRYTDPSSWYGIHIQSPNVLILQRAKNGDKYSNTQVGNYSNGQTIHFKIEIVGSHVKIYAGSPLTLAIDYPDVGEDFPTGKIALQASAGSDPVSETYFDNIVVTSIDPVLNVPALKQTSDPWQSQIYDTADSWNPSASTIKDWGCALTSAAMILQFYGINKLPDGTGLDPGGLNSWLKNQTDGYVGNGLINWLAVSRLTKLAKSINNISSFDALEYRRINGENKDQLTQDIVNLKQPDILEEPGHFVVAKGVNDSTFQINDPYYDRSALSDGYANTFLSLGRYIPSQTNLSYIMVVGNLDTDFYLASASGQKVGSNGISSFAEIDNAYYYTQNGIINPSNGSSSLGQKILLVPVPLDGDYALYLTTSGLSLKQEEVKLYEYSISGDVKLNTLSGKTKKDEPAVFSFNYKQNPDGIENAPVNKTPPQMIKALTLDKNKNGKLDTVRVEFLNDINGSTLNSSGSDFSISGRSITHADETEPGVVEITLNEENFDTGDTFLLTLKGDGLGTNSFGLKDVATAAWNHEQTIGTIDSAAPSQVAINIPGGDYLVYQDVILSSSDSANPVNIYYTLDASDPATSASRFLYSGPVRIDNDLTLKVVSFDPSDNQSDLITATYGIAPTIDNDSVATSGITDTSFTVGWTTNRPAKSRVVFGKNSIATPSADLNYGYESTSDEDVTFVTNHLLTVQNLTPGVTYFYRVLSRASPEQISQEKSITLPNTILVSTSGEAVANAVSNSSANFSSAGPIVCVYEKPKSAPKITSVFVGLNTVTLTWEEPEGPLSYYLISYGIESGKPLYGNTNIGGRGTTSYVIQDLSGGQTYYFRVRAGNNCATGDYSNEVSATPLGFAVNSEPSGFSQGVLGATKNILEEKKEIKLFKTAAQVKGAAVSKELNKKIIYFAISIVVILITAIIYWLKIRKRIK